MEESAMRGLRALGIGLALVGLLGCAAPGGQGAAPGGQGADAGAAPAAVGAAAPPPAAAQEKITFALPAVSGVFAPHILADQKGFFREEGFAVEMPVTRSNLIPPGLAAGEIDYAGSFSPSVRNALSGMPIRVIAATVSKSTRQLMVLPTIQSMDQLRGTNIAVTTIGDGPYNSGVLALEAYGIDPQTEVTWLGVGSGMERMLTMQQGLTQASIFAGAEIPRAEAFGFVTLLRLDDVAPLPESGVATSLAKLENDRGQVKRVLRAIVRALQYLKSDREGSLPTFVQFLGLSREEAGAAYDSIAYAFSDDGTLGDRGMRFTLDAEKKQLGIAEDVPPSRVADFGPLYELLPELGLTPAPDAAR
jgi:ABC-type nitrate/sulfonate/bicarbonate transport system substrate-binding protein